MRARQGTTDQERLLAALSRRSLGAGAVFHPDLYAGNQEPADVAWVAGRTAVLMWCTTKGRSFAKAASHNVEQAKTWLNLWSDELTLTGRNAEREFDVKRSEVDNVIAISVVSTRESRGLIHLDYMRRPGVNSPCLIGTLPQSIVFKLAELGASIGDFVYLFSMIANWGGAVEEILLHSMLDSYASLTDDLLDPKHLLADQVDSIEFIKPRLMALRSERITDSSTNLQVLDFAELGLHEQRWILHLLVWAIVEMESRVNTKASTRYSIRYEIFENTCLGAIATLLNEPKEMQAALSAFEADVKKPYVIWFAYLTRNSTWFSVETKSPGAFKNIGIALDKLALAIKNNDREILLNCATIDLTNNPRNPRGGDK